MKSPKEMRARAERYRGHARAITDPAVQEVIQSVADNLEQEAERIEHEQSKARDKPVRRRASGPQQRCPG